MSGNGSVDGTCLITNELNRTILAQEVDKGITKLKNDKASGLDLILNEFLKCAAPKLLEPIALLFDTILRCGKIPESWAAGVICPIYKGKGCTKESTNSTPTWHLRNPR